MCVCTVCVPVLVVDPRAVEQGGQDVLSWTHALQYQADPVQRGQQEEDERQQEAAMIGLSHTVVYPAIGIDGHDTHTRIDKTEHCTETLGYTHTARRF